MTVNIMHQKVVMEISMWLFVERCLASLAHLLFILSAIFRQFFSPSRSSVFLASSLMVTQPALCRERSCSSIQGQGFRKFVFELFHLECRWLHDCFPAHRPCSLFLASFRHPEVPRLFLRNRILVHRLLSFSFCLRFLSDLPLCFTGASACHYRSSSRLLQAGRWNTSSSTARFTATFVPIYIPLKSRDR